MQSFSSLLVCWAIPLALLLLVCKGEPPLLLLQRRRQCAFLVVSPVSLRSASPSPFSAHSGSMPPVSLLFSAKHAHTRGGRGKEKHGKGTPKRKSKTTGGGGRHKASLYNRDKLLGETERDETGRAKGPQTVTAGIPVSFSAVSPAAEDLIEDVDGIEESGGGLSGSVTGSVSTASEYSEFSDRMEMEEERRRIALLPPGAEKLRRLQLMDDEEAQGNDHKFPVQLESTKRPVFVFTDDLDEGTRGQLEALASQPFVVGHVAAMPDVHLGKGATIGSVFASRDGVCPNAVGVDIGCGMCAVPVEGLKRGDLTSAQLQKIQKGIKQLVPVGFSYYDEPVEGAREGVERLMKKKYVGAEGGEEDTEEEGKVNVEGSKGKRQRRSHSNQEAVGPTDTLLQMLEERHLCQVGTLGGGNHFIELVFDENDDVWMMLHSGSRNIGNIIAQHYDQQAARVSGEKPNGLAWLPIRSREGQDYLRDMRWCQDYAMLNRERMMNSFARVVRDVTGKEMKKHEMVNIHHNYCNCEMCKYRDENSGEMVEEKLWVTRKGATSARKGQLGIIPGSMGTGSFITEGLGAWTSLHSCSHGAGRRMSRNKAVKELDMKDFRMAMEGITCDVNQKVLDEAPMAYKDLGEVMSNQRTLVKAKHRLFPLVNVKGY
uniref:3'-phosphate/5'-hydroxy nucleic acid ligase n=1 Tax=Chromera velia CCMP2878 TaxID=1169474 RepID=A0A0G4GH76_9ALVE|mmetsp:Transcript_19255/g.38821  ORF Transcript_19255/g.38821 Transcript_19255/m.38821 type:complete len:656 (-) Transcript_19255:282-2249(-)|eukprot:Cvel_21903.t1-p1 / transcript=Cvel_21903.t1 / gene=Cvel_21903 / organism=Chromera_velia_CCMP2878 / gene_product=RNA-splicing ligase RtcB, putative / transcript_product=RNA-splicing ligase RtcB, putative / location=Cvel_scaffold2098:6259-11824(-) / protein_length=655 / sequence_SO=supercontig / SO=protein_coding / is_pseudo=false